MLTPWKESCDQPRQHITKQRHSFVNKGPSSQSYGFSSGHVWMWELDYKESWARKNWCFWTVVLVGESGLETCWRRSLEVFLGLRQESQGFLDLCRWPQGASHGGSRRSGKVELGGASQDSTGFGAAAAAGTLFLSIFSISYWIFLHIRIICTLNQILCSNNPR